MPVKKEDLSLKAIRHMLASIDLSDFQDEEEMSESERLDYCAAIFAIFPRLENDIKRMLYEQLMFASNEAGNWEQVVFSRGTFNGMDLLLEKWKKASAEYQSKHKENQENKEIDQTNVFPEI